MKKLILIYFFLFCFFAQAQDAKQELWKDALLKSKESITNKIEEEMEPLAISALNLAKNTKSISNKDLADCYFNLGDTYFWLNKYDEAIDPIEKSASLYLKSLGNKSDQYISSISTLGAIYYSKGDYIKAEKYNLTLENILKNEPKSIEDYAAILGSLGEIKRKQNQYKEASFYFNNCQKAFINNKDTNSNNYGSLLINIANYEMDFSNFDKAKTLLNQAIKIFEKNKESILLADCYKTLGILYKEIGDYNNAELLIKKAGKIYAENWGSESLEYAKYTSDLSVLYSSMGNYKLAEEYYDTTLNIKSKIVGIEHPSYLISLSNYSLFLSKIFKFNESILKLKQVVSTLEKLGLKNQIEYADAIANLGSIYASNYDYPKAESLLKKAMDIRFENNHSKDIEYANLLSNLSIIYSKQNENNKSLECSKEALSIVLSNPNSSKIDIATKYLNIGEQLSIQGSHQDAIINTKNALKIFTDILPENHPTILICETNLALEYRRMGDLESAEVLELKNINQTFALSHNYFNFLTEKEKLDYWYEQQSNLESFYNYCLNRRFKNPNIISNMCDARLTEKSFVLNYTNIWKRKVENSKDNKIKNIYSKWELQKAKLAKLYTYSKTELFLKGINIKESENQVNTLEKELVKLTFDYSKELQLTNVKWKDIQAKLKPNEAAVEMIKMELFDQKWLDSSIYIALIITKECQNEPILVVMPLGGKKSLKFLKYYRTCISLKIKDDLSYQNFWKAIDDKIIGKNTIYFSPAGIYNRISIPTLLLPNGKYLIEEKNIKIVPTLKNIAINNSNNNDTKSAVLLGYPDFEKKYLNTEKNSENSIFTINNTIYDDVVRNIVLTELPGTKVEIEKVEKSLLLNKWKVDKYLLQQATEENIKKINNPSILHIATHGYFETKDTISTNNKIIGIERNAANNNPMLRSGLLLASASNAIKGEEVPIGIEDGILTAFEASMLNLSQTKLVILSACETGLGEESKNSGVFGLQRAFQLAGAKNVLMSLWKVSDIGTQQLINEFFNQYLKTNNIQESFRNAQLQLLKSNADPYIWGAFVLMSN